MRDGRNPTDCRRRRFHGIQSISHASKTKKDKEIQRKTAKTVISPKYSEWKISLAGLDQLWFDGRLESGRMWGNSSCNQLGCHRGALYQVRRLFTSENAKKDRGPNFEAFVFLHHFLKQRKGFITPQICKNSNPARSFSPSGKQEQRQRTTFPLCWASSTSAATVTASTPKGFGSLDLQAPKILPGKMSSSKLTQSCTRITTPPSPCPTTSPCSSSLRRSNSTKQC